MPSLQVTEVHTGSVTPTSTTVSLTGAVAGDLVILMLVDSNSFVDDFHANTGYWDNQPAWTFIDGEASTHAGHVWTGFSWSAYRYRLTSSDIAAGSLSVAYFGDTSKPGYGVYSIFRNVSTASFITGVSYWGDDYTAFPTEEFASQSWVQGAVIVGFIGYAQTTVASPSFGSSVQHFAGSRNGYGLVEMIATAPNSPSAIPSGTFPFSIGSAAGPPGTNQVFAIGGIALLLQGTFVPTGDWLAPILIDLDWERIEDAPYKNGDYQRLAVSIPVTNHKTSTAPAHYVPTTITPTNTGNNTPGAPGSSVQVVWYLIDPTQRYPFFNQGGTTLRLDFSGCTHVTGFALYNRMTDDAPTYSVYLDQPVYGISGGEDAIKDVNIEPNYPYWLAVEYYTSASATQQFYVTLGQSRDLNEMVPDPGYAVVVVQLTDPELRVNGGDVIADLGVTFQLLFRGNNRLWQPPWQVEVEWPDGSTQAVSSALINDDPYHRFTVVMDHPWVVPTPPGSLPNAVQVRYRTVHGDGYWSEHVFIPWYDPAAPANDDFQNAEVIPVSLTPGNIVSVSGTTKHATYEVGDPLMLGGERPGVWYEIHTGQNCALYIIDQGTSFSDLTAFLYRHDNPAAGLLGLRELASGSIGFPGSHFEFADDGRIGIDSYTGVSSVILGSGIHYLVLSGPNLDFTVLVHADPLPGPRCAPDPTPYLHDQPDFGDGVETAPVTITQPVPGMLIFGQVNLETMVGGLEHVIYGYTEEHGVFFYDYADRWQGYRQGFATPDTVFGNGILTVNEVTGAQLLYYVANSDYGVAPYNYNPNWLGRYGQRVEFQTRFHLRMPDAAGNLQYTSDAWLWGKGHGFTEDDLRESQTVWAGASNPNSVYTATVIFDPVLSQTQYTFRELSFDGSTLKASIPLATIPGGNLDEVNIAIHPDDADVVFIQTVAGIGDSTIYRLSRSTGVLTPLGTAPSGPLLGWTKATGATGLVFASSLFRADGTTVRSCDDLSVVLAEIDDATPPSDEFEPYWYTYAAGLGPGNNSVCFASWRNLRPTITRANETFCSKLRLWDIATGTFTDLDNLCTNTHDNYDDGGTDVNYIFVENVLPALIIPPAPFACANLGGATKSVDNYFARGSTSG